MWDEIQDMQGEIFDIRDDDLMEVFDDTMKEDSKGNLHTYMHIEDDTWNYEKYDENDNVLVSKSFTL